MLIGIDWGGTKIEIIALADDGSPLLRKRIATPQNDYEACVDAAVSLVDLCEAQLGEAAHIGFGIPGTISPATGLVKNANSTWLNGRNLKADLETKLQREVRIQNDANCFTVSEAVDGAGAGKSIVAGIILGTGCGSGITIDGKALAGAQGIAGEFGHTPLPFMTAEEYPGHECWCGRRGCLETYISGTGFSRDFKARTAGASLQPVSEILVMNTAESRACYEAYCDRLARGLSTIVNLIDPDVIVLGGGMSNIDQLYSDLPNLIKDHVFSDGFTTPILRAHHGDSSGVRGAAWLWR
ncbi:MAG: ROK family protein [Hyphomicrobiales bacterium]